MTAGVGLLLAVATPTEAQVVEPTDGWRAVTAAVDVDLSGPDVRHDAWPSADPTVQWEAQGFAPTDDVLWYRRTVAVASGESPGAVLVLPSRHGWLRIYADGVRIGQVGSESSPYPFPRYHTFRVPARLLEDGAVTLALRFERRPWLPRALNLRDGPVGTIAVGPAADIEQRHALQVLVNRQDQLAALLFAFLFLIVGAYHLLLFHGGGADREYLWFGVAAILIAVNTLGFSAWTPAFVDSYATSYRITDGTGHLATAALISFLWGLLDRPMGRLLRGYQLSQLGLALFVAVAPLQWVVVTSLPRFAWLLPIFLAAIWVLQDESSRGNPDAVPLAVGGGILVLAELGEVARVAGLDLPHGLPAVGFAVLLLSMAVALTRRFNRTRAELDALTGQLEERVAERTAFLRHEADTARAANESKTRLLSAMSHELRTPLNSVIGFTRVMLRKDAEELSERDRGFVRRIHKSGRELLGLIDQILDMARIEEGHFQLRVQEGVDLAAVIQSVVEEVDPLLEGRRVGLRAVVPTELRTLRTDPDRLRQVLLGLTTNAVKHTTEGTVTIRAVAHRDVPMAVEVVDTGMGMTSEELERLEQPFDGGEATESRSYEGLGLGLALARAVCDELGYDLKVTSDREHGSTFRVLLAPSAIETRRAPAELEAVLELIQTRTAGDRVVLVIDDDPDARALMAELLGELGCTAVPASSGEEGMRLARELQPDLVTLDLRMPGLDGWTVLNAFQEDEKLADIPIIVVSVVAEEARGEVLGPVEMVSKPIDPAELARAVARQTGRRAARTLVVDDDPDARALLGGPLADMGSEVREASNGREALAALDDFEPDLVLLDLVMPGMDGFEFLERLRRDPEHANLPVIIVTSKQLDRAEVRLLRQTSQGLVRKERRLDRGELRERLARYLAGAESGRTGAAAPEV